MKISLLIILGFILNMSIYAQSGPNVIIIFTDDLGYGDLASYGHPTIKTPALDRMADEGMRFTQFYVAAAVCTPSRAALLTGRYPVRTGMVKGLIPGDVLFPNDQTGLPMNEVTIAEILKEQGYSTYMVGKWHLGHLPEFLPVKQGFDHYYGIPYSNDMDHIGAKDGKPAYWNVPLIEDTTIIERPVDQSTITRRYTEKAISFIKSHKEKPFFLYLAHSMPHVPLFTSEKFKNSSIAGAYGDVIQEIDWSVGQILAELKNLKLDKNTLVIFTSDNGPWLVQKQNGGSAGILKEGKGTTWEGGMRVPMIAWWPETIEEGQTAYNLSSSLDLLPTVAEACSASVPENIDGVSILPLLKGDKKNPREFFAFHRYGEVYAVRYGPWKAHYITQTAYPTKPKEIHEPPLLYNLEVDPSERFNVGKENPEILEIIKEWRNNHIKTITKERVPSIEAESLVNTTQISGGKLRIQDMQNFSGNWSGGKQLWWVEAKPGDKADFTLNVDKAGSRELFGFFTRGNDYGIIKVYVNDKAVGPLVDGYCEGVTTTGPVSFGMVELKENGNTITIEIIGKDYLSGGFSNGYLVGIDGFLLK